MRQNRSLAVEDNRYDDAAGTDRDRKTELEQQLERLRTGWDRANSPVVTADDIAEVVSMWTGVPVMQMAQEESERLLKMEDELHKHIIGQEDAIEAISKAVRRARAGLKDPRRPIGSFIFLGPTGVGKTELTKALAKLPVRQRRCPGAAGYVRVHGTPYRQPPGRRASRLRGLRRGRSADRSHPPPSLLHRRLR